MVRGQVGPSPVVLDISIHGQDQGQVVPSPVVLDIKIHEEKHSCWIRMFFRSVSGFKTRIRMNIIYFYRWLELLPGFPEYNKPIK